MEAVTSTSLLCSPLLFVRALTVHNTERTSPEQGQKTEKRLLRLSKLTLLLLHIARD